MGSRQSSSALLTPGGTLNASWAVDVSEIKFGARLGVGAYGEVFVAEWRRSKVAVKRLITSALDETAVEQFIAEMEILANARHDRIVRFLGGCVQRDNLCILFEWCPQSLFDLLQTANAPLSAARVATIASEVALGIYYLHCCKPPVLHLDLKSANVLLDQHGQAKVCDFGLAHLKLDGGGVITARTGSPMWTAPEVLKGETITEAADTYSFGMLLFELLTRRLPHGNVSAPQVVIGVITGMLKQPEYHAGVAGRAYPEPLPDLMRTCWQYETAKRPSFETVLDQLDEIASQLHIST